MKGMVVSKRGYGLDTCIIVNSFEDQNFVDFLNCRIDFSDSEILLNSKTVEELNRHGYDYGYVSSRLTELFGAEVSFTEVSDEMFADAKYLQRLHPTLHSGDDEILAFVIATDSVLVTCDRGLATAAKNSDVEVINPDIVDFGGLPVPSVNKKFTNHFAKPGLKLSWRAFA